MTQPRTAVIIVAAGRGSRMGGGLPKQYREVAGSPVLARVVELFLGIGAVDAVLPVINPADASQCASALAGIADARLMPPVHGGLTRSASVVAGLDALAPMAPDYVLIHDAARCFTPPGVVRAVIAALAEAPGAFAALPVVDALWSASGDAADAPVPRDGLWRAQTPQGFHFPAIRAAYGAASVDAADDVAIARAAGLTVRIVPGDEAGFKITTPADMDRAEALARSKR